MIVISTAATVYIFRKSSYQWVKFMYVLCVLQNYVTLYLSCGDYYEQSRYHYTETDLVAWTISSAVFLFFFFTIIIYWLFGFKYWIISIEVPKFLNGEMPTPSETRYAIINYSAISFLVFACGVTAYFRFQLSRQEVGDPHLPDNHLFWILFVLYTFIALLLIVTSIFLGDALRRLRKQIVKTNNL